MDKMARMRTTMNISLPASLKQWIEEQVSVGGYSTASEYIRDILRREQNSRSKIDAHLMEAIKSGASTPMTRKDWRRIRSEGLKLSRRRGK
jgi:antitoxin ParD1/3/4